MVKDTPVIFTGRLPAKRESGVTGGARCWDQRRAIKLTLVAMPAKGPEKPHIKETGSCSAHKGRISSGSSISCLE